MADWNFKDAREIKQVEGRYYWNLLFDETNPEGNLPFEHKYKTTKQKTLYTKNFMKKTFNLNSAFSYKNEASASMNFEGIADLSDRAEWNIHMDTGYELVDSFEKDKTIDETETLERIYQIGPGATVALYQLCYVLDNGVDVKTETTTTNPRPDIKVKLNFSLERRVLGLSDILYKFNRTNPEWSNRTEWQKIRDSIIQKSNTSALNQFKNFVETLNGIKPESDNSLEWQRIRGTCQEILNDWGGPETWGEGEKDKQLLFEKLLRRFLDINPSQDNKKEWREIRDLSTEIIQNLNKLPFSVAEPPNIPTEVPKK